ncbi:MAG: malate dehydrogenase [Candidatus Omnitrophota bacterium]
MPKVSIIGAGNVGGTLALRIVERQFASVTLIDIASSLACAKAFDIKDSQKSLNKQFDIVGTTDFSYLKDSNVIVITAGVARKPGMTREDLLLINSKIIKDISAQIKQFCSHDTIVIIVTNPLDIITYIAYKELGFMREKIIGFGMNLDASRFANIISEKLSVSVTEINPLVVASHGQEMLPLARFTLVRGKPLTEICNKTIIDEIIKLTMNRGAEIVSLYKTGSAYYAPSAGLLELIEIILNDQKKQTTASCFLNGEYGLKDVCLGVPVVLSRDGIEKIIELDLNLEEKELFQKAASVIKNSLPK